MKFLKIFSEYFQAVIEHRKPFEIRYNDRDFKTGDLYVLEEITDDGIYTGHKCIIVIKDIFKLDKAGFTNYVAFTFNIIDIIK